MLALVRIATASLMMAAATVVASPAAGTALAATSAAPSAPMPQTASLGHAKTVTKAAITGRIVLKGFAKRASGSQIRHGYVSIHPVSKKVRASLIGAGRTGPKGGFSIAIRRSASLARYAATHNGRINVVIWVYRAGRVYLRAVQVPYTRAGKRPVDEFRMGVRHFPASQPSSWRRGKAGAPGKAYSGDVVGRHWTTIGRISASRGFTTRLKYYRNLETSVSFGILYSGKFTGSGSTAIAENSGVSLEPTLRGIGQRRNIQVEILHRAYTVCDYRTWMNGGRQCSTYVVPSWSGGFQATKATYRGCKHVPHENGVWIAVEKNVGWSVSKTRGRSFSSTWSMGGYGGAVGSSTQFSSTNVQSWSVPSARGTAIAKFCIAGTDGYWHSASEVLTQSAMPDRPCNPPKARRDPAKC